MRIVARPGARAFGLRQPLQLVGALQASMGGAPLFSMRGLLSCHAS